MAAHSPGRPLPRLQRDASRRHGPTTNPRRLGTMVANRAAITTITIPAAGTTGEAEHRLIHADCLHRSGPTPLPATPSGLA